MLQGAVLNRFPTLGVLAQVALYRQVFGIPFPQENTAFSSLPTSTC